ncbi:MAG: hypothetical protein D6712_10485 [Chloroflexi bacterium]|nr:MAG: hypothetical protein D6712_10485 [Chloroflexota bacterium]
MLKIARLFREIADDILNGRHIETYFVTAAGLVLIAVEFFGDAPEDLQLTALLMGVTLLVFNLTRRDRTNIDLDSVLKDRQSLPDFREYIKGGKDLYIYAPSAVNVLARSPDIEREILQRGGKLRVVLQDPNAKNNIAILQDQLDHMAKLLEADIERSVNILEGLKQRGWDVEYRFLQYSPGFSLVLINPDERDGRAVVEFFGISNDQITDRMHISIEREESTYWLEYWERQFNIIWDKARSPQLTAAS